MMSNETIDILLATYQGALYLETQLKSIFNQTYSHFHLWARDDGSTDETWSILKKWQQLHPDKMTLFAPKQQLGAKGNFATLLDFSTAPYVMFADQDDEWHPHKIEITYAHCKNLESRFGRHTPLLVHTDATVVTENLGLIAPSFWKYSGLNPSHVSINRLVTQNVLTGCTFLMNRPLIQLSLPIPNEAIMHDWWIGLVASCFGKIEHLPQATLLYRQHHLNDVGARPYRLWHYLTDKRSKASRCICRTFKQADSFLSHYHTRLTSEQQTLFKTYASLGHSSFFQQKKDILRYRFLKQGFLRNIKHLFTHCC